MRLDKFLKVSRIIKRRTIANEACDAGRITVNGRNAKASYNVNVGDKVEVELGNRKIKFKVIKVNECIKKEEAQSMYEMID